MFTSIFTVTALRWPSYSGLSPSALFDYRLNPWFVEAATSAKDIVIIADFSTALSDYKLSLVRATTLAALDTLGANDFVNVLSLEPSNYEVVPCFKEVIVQVNSFNIINNINKHIWNDYTFDITQILC